jgi:sporulation protein YlmC with PRC-barrel domain
MGLIRPIWLPGKERDPAGAARFNGVAQLREQRARRWRETAAAHALEGSLISLAAILGTEVRDSAGERVGRLRDVVVHWSNAAAYPPATAIIVRSGRRDVLIGASWVEASAPVPVRLRSAAAYARAVERHPGEVALARDVLDRQVVDKDGTQLVRPSDVYLAAFDGRIDLVGIEVGPRALLRRIGPRRLRRHVRPERFIDWATIRSFSPVRADEVHSRRHPSALAGQTGAVLELDVAAAEVRELRASDIEAALRSAADKEGDGSS